ncbi:MAG: PD-(D/E)XK nuclease family protein [Alphaproteobacteria bacterium]|nr:PD-(D/E)XK nuclease family protein [Alphaproteobacteria bacterium]
MLNQDNHKGTRMSGIGADTQKQEILPFLKEVAGYLVSSYGSELGEICVVTPNRRAGIYLRKYLADFVTGPVWAPAIYAIEDFMALLSGMTEVEPVQLLTDLYEIHRTVEKEKARSFEEFLSWGSQLLSDFNDIDRNLADGTVLFNYLDEAKALALWNPDGTPLTSFQQEYLRFYRSLGSYYELLKESLIGRKTGYQGLVFRQAAERVATGNAEMPWKSIVFTGFNVLTRAEEEVMNLLHLEGIARFFWDADCFYLDHEHREAGVFLRRWLKKWPILASNPVSDSFRKNKKNIEVIGIPDLVGQIKFCGELLRTLGPETAEETAVILPDEKLLLPVMNALPPEVTQFNVTMGFPLKQTPLAFLLEQTFYLHIHSAAMLAGRSDTGKFYYRDLVRVLRNPLLTRIAARLHGDCFALNELITRLMTGDQVFISLDNLQGMGLFGFAPGFLDVFLTTWQSPGDVIRDLRQITDWTRMEPFESESAYVMATILHRLEVVAEQHVSWFSLPTLYQFLRELVNTASLPFVGEPLHGVQIMGMLETRTLDFKNLIILSCNEGLLPTGKTAHSFIPYDIRYEYGLPTYRQKDAIYAYHFFRLLQRAEKVWLLYNTEPDKLTGGEISRYVRQVIRELPQYNPDIAVRQQILNPGIFKVNDNRSIEISKEGWVLRKIRDKVAEGLSPTALNAFRKCSLQFYLSEIAGIREQDDPGDTIDSRMLGTAVHHALYRLFTPVKGRDLRVSDIDAMKGSAEQAVRSAFEEKFKKSALNYGKNLLLVHVATRMVQNFLQSEHTRIVNPRNTGAGIRVEVLEQPVWRTFTMNVDTGNQEARIKGFIDRADRIGHILQVVDYKTGKVDRKELLIESWDELLDDPKKDKGFQLLTYAWLLSGEDHPRSLRTGVISLQTPLPAFLPVIIKDGAETLSAKNPHPENFTPEDPSDGPEEGSPEEQGNLSGNDIKAFEQVLRKLVGRLLDPEIPIRSAESSDPCRNCRYLNLCGKAVAF